MKQVLQTLVTGRLLPGKTLQIIIVCYLATIAEGFWSMFNCIDHLSSQCLRCSLAGELVYYYAIVTIIPIILVLYIATRLKWNRWITAALVVLSLLFIWFFAVNTSIFETRVADWSTYTNQEIRYHTFRLSIIPMTITGLLVYISMAWILRK